MGPISRRILLQMLWRQKNGDSRSILGALTLHLVAFRSYLLVEQPERGCSRGKCLAWLNVTAKAATAVTTGHGICDNWRFVTHTPEPCLRFDGYEGPAYIMIIKRVYAEVFQLHWKGVLQIFIVL